MSLNPTQPIPTAVACLVFAASGLLFQEAARKVAEPTKRVDEPANSAATAIMRAVGADQPTKMIAAAKLDAIAAARIDANITMLIPRKTGQIRPYLRTDYHFLVAVVSPTKAQRQAIATAGEAALRDAAQRDAEWQLGRRRAGSLTPPDPPARLREALIEAARTHLDPEGFARYRDAMAARTASQRRAIRLNIVANLDRTLYFSASQREAIGASLAANWDEGWDRSLQFLVNDGPYTVTIPDPLIVPHLTEAQKVAWNTFQKVASPTWVAARANNNQAVDDVPLEDARLDPAPPATPKP